MAMKSRIWTYPQKSNRLQANFVTTSPIDLNHFFSITISPHLKLCVASFMIFLPFWRYPPSGIFLFRIVSTCRLKANIQLFRLKQKSLRTCSSLVRKSPLSFPSRHFVVFDFFHQKDLCWLSGCSTWKCKHEHLALLSNLFRCDCWKRILSLMLKSWFWV